MTRDKLIEEIFQAARRLDTNRPYTRANWLKEINRIVKLNKKHKIPLDGLVRMGLQAVN